MLAPGLESTQIQNLQVPHQFASNDMTDANYAPAPALAPAELPPSYDMIAQPTGAVPHTPALLPLPLNIIRFLRDRRVILASASPRRRQLLAQVVFLAHVLILELMS